MKFKATCSLKLAVHFFATENCYEKFGRLQEVVPRLQLHFCPCSLIISIT